MPRAFKASPDHPAVAYLVRLHADIGGKLLENRKEAKHLAASMKHVEYVIRLFDPSYDVHHISARRRNKGNAWFKRGTIIRGALDVLRKAQTPLTAREIAERMLAAKGARDDASPKAVHNLIASVQMSLQNHDGKSVRRVGMEIPRRWGIA